mgnify:CR=1 FL=1
MNTLSMERMSNDSMSWPDDSLKSRVPVTLTIDYEKVNTRLASVSTFRASSSGETDSSVGAVVSALLGSSVSLA